MVVRMNNKTETVPENIKKACELAKNPGSCKYSNKDGSPCCVIGQLYVLEGFDVTEFSCQNTTIDHVKAENIDLLFSKYTKDRLTTLQFYWDSNNDATNEQLLEKAEEIWSSS